MKYAVFLLGALASMAAAQDRITVPLTDPSRIATIRVDTMHGSILVRGHEGREVLVEQHGDGARRPSRREKERAETAGLKRIDVGGAGLSIAEQDNVVTIGGPAFRGGNITIEVPRNANLKLKTMSGGVTVEGIHGEIEANSLNGEVTLRAVEGSVVAHSLNGDVRVVLDRVENKPMSFSTMNGTIDVTLPADVKARFKLRNDRGEIYSDFDMNLEPARPRETKKDGMHKVQFEREAYATVNGGGPEIAFRTFNGEIRIRKK